MNIIIKIYFLLLPFLFFTCSNQKEKTSEIFIKDNIIYKMGEKHPYTGSVIDTVNNKIIEYEVNDGIKDGSFKIYYSNGNPEMIGNVEKNKNSGEWKYFYLGGELESKGIFKDDLPSGSWLWFYPDSSLKQKGFYSGGKKEGEWIYFSKEGDTLIYKMFKADSLIFSR